MMMGEEQEEMNIKNVMCLLTDPEGTPLGASMYLPQDTGPLQLQELVNKLLNNEERFPYSFYISDQELLVQLGSYLEKNKVSVEKVLRIVYQPQAIFRIRPVNRCSATIAGHTDAVLTVSFSPDGRQLASGSGDTTVRLWDLSTQTPLFTCTGHKNWVLCIAWSPDGKHLVSGSKAGDILSWETQTGKPSGNPFIGHKKWITGIAWEPVHLKSPCRRFVTSSKDGDARIWDVTLRKCVINLTGHTLAVTCVKWGGDGMIYTGSQDCTIKVWETSQGKLIRELKGHGHWVNTLALSTEYVLRTGAFDHSGKQYSSPEEMKEVAQERYNKMLGNAPERLVSGSDDFTMILWEPSVSKNAKARLTGHQQLVNHVYFSPDGLWIASASFDKSVKLWNGITGKFVAVFRGHVGPVYQISWSADSRLLLSGSKDSTLKVWDIRKLKLKQDLPGHEDEVFTGNMGKKSEPTITKCKEKENWTQVTFKPDLAKFNMTHLEEDVVAIMKKRVLDIAGCLGKTVKVDLNGQRLPVKSFLDYVDLYLKSKSSSESLPRFTEKVNDRWEICVSISEGQFQQVSFVNSISTIKGGTHVDYVTNQITSHVMNLVNKKNKHANMKAHTVKNHLWVFVNALIDNPAFDSQTKETLTTRQNSFGSTCELSPEFLKKVANSEIVERLLSWAEFKLSKELKKTDGAKRQKVSGIPKLVDANDAGGKDSDKCTLILTEGDSAKALAVSGIGVVGQNYYGVFPLRGKLLNVREASHKQIMENAEIQHIKQILGLQHGKVYNNVKSLRYGHLMIMTDQDHDGSHIKGLLINFIHSFWPSLLKIPSFLVEFITPIVKATHRNGNVLSFYTMPEYESWKESLGGGKAIGWSIKYYKGLGTSTGKEAKEYFQSLETHKKDFTWVDEGDGDAIDMAFSKKKIEARKTWLRQYEPGTYLNQKEKLIKYSDFINKELILFSLADLQRSIPSMVDGLKPGQRKILFCAFKRNLVNEIKVAQFSGYVSEHSAYHHGEQSLAGAIVGMAQDFVGSNNINLFNPGGQFGTRHQGGKDHASARYIFTNLTPIARFLFPKDDDILLDYLNEDGQRIEPTWYAPIIPLVLVNGSEGIGTGWSTFVPNYNPRDLCANVRRLLRGEPMVPIDPWYKGFQGTIEKTTIKESGASYTLSGIIEQIDETTLRITELPVRRWTQDYKEFLETAVTGTDKIKEPFIKDYREHNDDTTVHFEIIMSEQNLRMAKEEGLMKKFKLTTTISTSNMHLFDPKGVIKKYDTPEQILEEFFHLRLQLYGKRKKMLLAHLELELLKLSNKVRFILGVVKGEIIVSNRKRADLFLELQQKGFTPFPKAKSIDSLVVGATDDVEENEENLEVATNGEENKREVRASDYDYLLSMAIGTLTLEKVQELCSQQEKLTSEVDELRKSTPETLWMKDLDALDQKLDELDNKDAIAEVDRKKLKGKVMNEAGMKASRPAAKNPRKNNTKKPTNPPVEEAAPVSSSMEMDNVSEAVKPPPKGRGGARKAPAKKPQQKPTVVDSDEDDEILELKDRLAAYNLDSSPDQPAALMEAGKVPSRKTAPSKRAAAQKQPATFLTEISDDDDTMDNDHSDEEFGVEVVAAPTGAKKGGRTAKAKVVKPVAETRKRVPTKKQLLNQKLITDVLKPVENAGPSPEKKVRKIRPSPFNKKSGSILGRMENKDDEISPMRVEEDNSGHPASTSPEEGSSEVVATRPRPVRANRRVAKYVVSESETDEPADESDFEEDESEDEE